MISLVCSELAHLSDNHLSGSGTLQMGPQGKSSTLKIIFFLTVPKRPLCLYVLIFIQRQFLRNFSALPGTVHFWGGWRSEVTRGGPAGMGLAVEQREWAECASGPFTAEFLLQLIFSSTRDPPAYVTKSQADSSLQEEHVFKIDS